MEQKSNKRRKRAAAAKRPCLACGTAFTAETPFLRICPLCKESEEWQSGNTDFALHEKEPANDN
ncbi:hypothetical protein [Dongia sp.]|uniref:hypothetical protein n=1 Tax=Dongia sp. TaxID=1977262 RepID=UPI0035B36C67